MNSANEGRPIWGPALTLNTKLQYPQTGQAMNEFLQTLATDLDHFPLVLILLLAPFCGSLVACIVLAIAGGPDADSPKKILGQFVVGWLTGTFCGPIVSPMFNAPAYTVGFITGASGYWGIKVYLKKQQDELLNRPPSP